MQIDSLSLSGFWVDRTELTTQLNCKELLREDLVVLQYATFVEVAT